MREASGFLTIDSMFFESREEAELHEARQEMIRKLGVLRINAEKFMAVLDNLWYESERYINAYKAAFPNSSTEQPGEAFESDTGIDERAGDFPEPEETIARILKQPPGRPVDVRDMGSGSRTEEVPDGLQGNGTGGGGEDAPDVRSSAPVAAKRGAKAPGPRRIRGPANLR